MSSIIEWAQLDAVSVERHVIGTRSCMCLLQLPLGRLGPTSDQFCDFNPKSCLQTLASMHHNLSYTLTCGSNFGVRGLPHNGPLPAQSRTPFEAYSTNVSPSVLLQLLLASQFRRFAGCPSLPLSLDLDPGRAGAILSGRGWDTFRPLRRP